MVIFCITKQGGGNQAFIQEAVTSNAQHRFIDIGMPYLTGFTRLLDKLFGQVTSTASNIEHLKAWTNASLGDSKNLPDAVQTTRHDVIHDVVFSCNRVKYLSNLMYFLLFVDGGVTEMGSIAHDIKTPMGCRIIGEVIMKGICWNTINLSIK